MKMRGNSHTKWSYKLCHYALMAVPCDIPQPLPICVHLKLLDQLFACHTQSSVDSIPPTH
jgi:hypothetical protein